MAVEKGSDVDHSNSSNSAPSVGAKNKIYREPNVIVTGTPGVGKTTFSQKLSDMTELRLLDVSTIIKECKYYKEWDDELDCNIFDEAQVAKHICSLLEEGGCIVDFHSTISLPPDLVDAVFILRTETDVLYDRLQKRGYNEAKISHNVQAEIFQVVLEEAYYQYIDNGENDSQESESSTESDTLHSNMSTSPTIFKELQNSCWKDYNCNLEECCNIIKIVRTNLRIPKIS